MALFTSGRFVAVPWFLELDWRLEVGSFVSAESTKPNVNSDSKKTLRTMRRRPRRRRAAVPAAINNSKGSADKQAKDTSTKDANSREHGQNTQSERNSERRDDAGSQSIVRHQHPIQHPVAKFLSGFLSTVMVASAILPVVIATWTVIKNGLSFFSNNLGSGKLDAKPSGILSESGSTNISGSTNFSGSTDSNTVPIGVPIYSATNSFNAQNFAQHSSDTVTNENHESKPDHTQQEQTNFNRNPYSSPQVEAEESQRETQERERQERQQAEQQQRDEEQRKHNERAQAEKARRQSSAARGDSQARRGETARKETAREQEETARQHARRREFFGRREFQDFVNSAAHSASENYARFERFCKDRSEEWNEHWNEACKKCFSQFERQSRSRHHSSNRQHSHSSNSHRSHQPDRNGTQSAAEIRLKELEELAIEEYKKLTTPQKAVMDKFNKDSEMLRDPNKRRLRGDEQWDEERRNKEFIRLHKIYHPDKFEINMKRVREATASGAGNRNARTAAATSGDSRGKKTDSTAKKNDFKFYSKILRRDVTNELTSDDFKPAAQRLNALRCCCRG